LNGPATLILTSIIIGCVQIAAIVLLTIRHRQRHGRCCVKQALLKSFFSFVRLLLFEWAILNVTALFTSLSFFGLPDLQFSSQSTFIVCVVSVLVQYALFVRYYVRKRRAFVYWRMRDCFIVRQLISFVRVDFLTRCLFCGKTGDAAARGCFLRCRNCVSHQLCQLSSGPAGAFIVVYCSIESSFQSG
jgi:hypothetical protein